MDELGEEVDGVLDVVEVGGLHNGVHAAQRQGNKRAGDALPAMEDLVGVRPGEAAASLMLERQLGLGGDVDEALDDERVVRRTVGNGRAAAEFYTAEFPVIDTRGVGGMGDIQTNAKVRLEPVGRHHRAIATDFLLHGIQADEGEGGFFPARRDAFHDLGDDVAADAIIDGTADDALVGEFHRPVLINGRVPNAQPEGSNLRGTCSTDIDPKIVDGGGFLRNGFIAPEVHGGIPDDARHAALVTEDRQPAAASGSGVRAAHAVDAQETTLVDVLDHEADLVGVSLKHEDAVGFPGERRPSGAIGIAVHLGRVLPDPIRPDPLSGHFESGGAGSFQQLEQKLAVVLLHARDSSSTAQAGKGGPWETAVMASRTKTRQLWHLEPKSGLSGNRCRRFFKVLKGDNTGTT